MSKPINSKKASKSSSYLKNLSFWSLILTFATSVVVVTYLAIREEGFRRSLALFEQQLGTSQLHYIRCGYNAEIAVSAYGPTHCLAVRNDGPTAATDISIVAATWDPYVALKPILVSPPFDTVTPHVSPDGAWLSYSIPSLPVSSCVEIWLVFDPTPLALEELSSERLSQYTFLFRDDFRPLLDLKVTCSNCMGLAQGDLQWPPAGSTMPPVVFPVLPNSPSTLNTPPSTPQGHFILTISYRDPCPTP